MSDINNYYFVYQLAKINNIEVDKAWEEKLKNLFTTLVKVAYPDKSAPVLQDDTEIPWAEKNDIRLPFIPSFADNNAHMFYLLCESKDQRTALENHLNEYGGNLYISAGFGISVFNLEALEFGDSYLQEELNESLSIVNKNRLDKEFYLHPEDGVTFIEKVISNANDKSKKYLKLFKIINRIRGD